MAQKKWAKAPYIVTLPNGETQTVIIGGRVRWAIEELWKAGPAGRTGREALGPRCAAYIWQAKHVHGIPIADAWESHEGEHPGRHKRWWLDSEILSCIQESEGQS
ncbi:MULTISPECIES: winged helix domain-containing protein [Mameliella]|uniref:Winged helix domain-containing protein n=1 Tax=Mameliella alba TaxID=561184 RepID=A0A0B3S928_9RHOB|nr:MULTISPECIES: hypothetical protein [Mameliella]KHQ53186.1 hypothetical protein OA50_02213 [Mameliella alba]MDD9728312.1 hypothetical protein [Mameliella sp. AT18]ODM48231.1 hypothetical protein A9320_19350 [Ruegeria sp. PBVC088]